MKNKYLIILLLLLLSLGTHARQKTDIKAKDLKGRVATLTETNLASPKLVRWGCILRVPVKPEFITKHTTHAMDNQGRQIEVSYFNKDSKLIKRTFYSYNDTNCITAVIQNDADGKLMNKVVYTYDASGYPSEVDYYNGKDSLYHPIDLAEKYFSNKCFYRFDQAGTIVDEEYLAKEEKPSGQKKATHPHTNDDEETAPDVTYNYLGQKARVTEFYANGNIKTRTYFRYDHDGSSLARNVTLFDTGGNAMQILNYDADTTITSVTYNRYEQYDAKGNWHTRLQWTVSDDFDWNYPSIYIVNREIEYN